MAAATKHARTTSPLPRCNGGRWRRWRPQARTRMRTAPLSVHNGSRRRGQCPRRCNSAHNWSKEGVFRQRDRSRRTRGATLPLRRRSHRGPQASSETVLDGLAGGTTPPYAPKNRRPPSITPSLGGNRAAAFVACHAQGPAGHAEHDAALHVWPAGPAGLDQPPQCSLRHMWRPVGRLRWTDNRGCGRRGAQEERV